MKIKHSGRYAKSINSEAAFERKARKSTHSWCVEENDGHWQKKYEKDREKGFTCLNCGFPVSVERELSGVINRNHCPRCLFSRHVDEFKAGDRKADCRSRMEPVGLSIKHTIKKYSAGTQGELMLIHRCTGCGKLSINRIAADDNAGMVYQLFRGSETLTSEFIEEILLQNITILGMADLTLVYSQLFGWQTILDEFQTTEAASDVPMQVPSEYLAEEMDHEYGMTNTPSLSKESVFESTMFSLG